MKKYRSKRELTLLLIILSSALKIAAQQLTPYVISTSGGFYNNASGMLSFTTGEMSAIETYTTTTNILTQGFQQVWPLGTAVPENHQTPVSFKIYPNPAGDFFNLEMKSDWNGPIDMEIVDFLGREMVKATCDKINSTQVQRIDVSHLPQGLYMINVVGKNKSSPASAYHFIGKIQIVR